MPRTTLNIEDAIFERVKGSAAKNRREISAEVTMLLEQALNAQEKAAKPVTRGAHADPA